MPNPTSRHPPTNCWRLFLRVTRMRRNYSTQSRRQPTTFFTDALTPLGALPYMWKARVMISMTDFAAVNRMALDALPTLVARWLPDGHRIGREWVCRNPRREDRRPGSFRVVLNGPKKGLWKDFASGEGGSDPVSLAAFIAGTKQTEAARSLAAMLGVRNA